jgi:PAS domain S-box-containing protein
LHETESTFHLLADLVPQMVWMCTPDGLNIYFNQRWVDYTGMSLEESYGKGWNTPFHADDRQRAWDAWNHAVATGTLYQVESRIRAADGSYRWFLMQGKPMLQSGSVSKWFGTCTDIEDMKRTEEVLRHTLERLEKVLAIQTVGVMFWDLDTGAMIDANDTFLNNMGYSRSDIEERKLFWHTLTPPEYMDVSRAEIEKFLTTGRVGPYEKEYFRKDGKRQWLLFAGSSLGGNQCVEFCIDISDRKKAEDALRASNNDLRQFAYAAAHDLQEPLRNVSTALEFFQRFHAAELTSGAQQTLHVALEGSQRAINMIKGLLKYSRILDEEHHATEPVSVNTAVSIAIANLKDTVESTNARITVECLPNVNVFEIHLVQVFQNLLSNALKYQIPGVPPEIHITVQTGGRFWEFSIQDNGIGFNPEYRDRIFGLFKRLHPDAYEGSGIGLALCQKIITSYGGRIWAESALGKGATFRFTLPVDGVPLVERAS